MTAHELFDQWSTYEKVVANDYMHHRAYFASLIDYLTSRGTSDISVLDLGCGDVKPVIPVFENFRIDRYVGVDDASEALERARALLESRVNFELIEASMEEASVSGTFDVIIASYSFHHLHRKGKQHMLEWCLARLNDRGVLAVIDVFLDPGESRDRYFDRWERNARLEWSALSSVEVAQLVEHVRSSDIPEHVADYEQLARAAGYKELRTLLAGPSGLNRLIVLEV